MEFKYIWLIFFFMFATSNACSTKTSINNAKQPVIESVECYRSPFCNKTRNYFNATQYLPFNFKMFDNQYAYYLSTEPEKWTPTCLHYGSNVDYSMNPHVPENIFSSLPDVFSVWIPAKREADTPFFMYELPYINIAPHYMISLNWTNDCLVSIQNKSQFNVNCNEMHHTLCIWDTTNLNLLQLACNERSATTWFSKYQDTCFSIRKIDEVTDNTTIAVIDSAEKQYIFTKLLEWYNDTTVNGPVLFNTLPDPENTARGRFSLELWMKSASEINFVNWEEGVKATNETVYSVVDPETGHWTLQDNNVIQFVFVEEKMTLKTPTIHHVIEEDDNNGPHLTLTNYKHFYHHRRQNEDMLLPITCKYNSLYVTKSFLETDKNERDEDVQKWVLNVYFKPFMKYYEFKCMGYVVPNFTKVNVVFEFNRNLENKFEEFIFKLNILDKDFRNYIDNIIDSIYTVLDINESDFKTNKSNGVTEHIYHVTKMQDNGNLLELRNKIQMDINDAVLTAKGTNFATEFQKLYNPEVFHTEICISDDSRFPNVRIGEVSIFTDFCVVKETGLPPFLDCVGSHIIGARWSQEVAVDLNECIVESDIPMSQFLYNLTQNQNNNNTVLTSEENVETIIGLVGNNSVKRAADVVYIAQVLQAASKIAADELFPDEPSIEVNSFMDSLINLTDKAITIDKETLRKSQRLNSTNSIVGSLELVAEKYSNSREFNESYVRIEDNAIVMIVNPIITNIVGIAIFASSKSRTCLSFRNCTVREIYHNHTVNNNTFGSFLADNGDLEVAAYVPLDVWKSMKGIQNRLIFIIYKNYTLFQERQTNQSITFDDNPIVRILIPNHGINLHANAVIIFRSNQLSDKKGLTTYNAAGFGKWNKKLLNCTNRAPDIVECRVNIQATVGFARLLSFYIPCLKVDLGYHQVIITMLTYVISSLSILGASVIILTFAIFPSFRKRLKSTLIPQISLSIILEHVFLQCAEIAGEDSFGSFPISFLFHYIVLVSFSLTIFSSRTHYYRFVVVMQYYQPVSHELKIFLIGWCCPLLFVSGSVLVYFCLSKILQLWMNVKNTCDCSGAICLSSDIILRFALHFPLFLMLVYNARVFYGIVVKFAQRNTDLDGVGISAPLTMGNKFVIRLLVKMAFSFSLTWIFGFLHIYVLKNTALHIISSYLFSILGGLQGFIFFLFVVVLDPNTRTSWCKLLHLNEREESDRNK